jgi:3,5-epimerase/4-reductase
MKALIFGNGFIGNLLNDYLDDSYLPIEVDARCRTMVSKIMDDSKPSVVINCVGKTGRPNIDWCETHKTETMESNVLVPLLLATECSKKGIHFVHISSGCIYSDRYGKNDFTEDDEPDFLGSFYSKTKVMAEKVLSVLPSLQLRIRMPIVSYPHDRNLITKLTKYENVIDIQNSVTVVDDFLAVTKALIDLRAEGIFNVVNNGSISASEIMELYTDIVDTSHRYNVMSREELNEVTLGERSNCILRTKKLEEYGLAMPSINKSIKQILRDYKMEKENGKDKKRNRR